MTKKVAGNGQEKTEKNPIGSGPPLKPLVWAVIARMCADHATEEEIGRWLGISADCLLDRCKGRWGMTFKEYYNENQAGGKISLRRAQWELALGKEGVPLKDEKGNIIIDDKHHIQWLMYPILPNPTMQIWLGKDVLNQKDKHEVSGPGGGPLIVKEIHVNHSD